MRVTFDKETHIYKIDGVVVPSNTQILSETGLVDSSWYTQEGADRGTAVHLACQLHDEDPIVEPYLSAYKKFLAESKFVPELIEVPMANHIHRYGTTIDRTGMLNGRDVLLELKTGVEQPFWPIQLALQNECLPKRLIRAALQLRIDGTYRLHEFMDPNDRQVALAAVTLYWWKKNNLKG